MSTFKKSQDEKLEIKEKKAVFANQNSNVYELRNVSTGNEKHLLIYRQKHSNRKLSEI